MDTVPDTWVVVWVHLCVLVAWICLFPTPGLLHFNNWSVMKC